MKIKINRLALITALDAVSPGVSTSTVVPEMQAVKITAGKEVRLATQSVQCGSEAFVAAEIEEAGECLVPYHKLSSMLQGQAEEVEMQADGSALKLRMGKAKAQMPTYDLAAAPAAKEDSSVAFVSVPGKSLWEVLNIAITSAGDGKVQAWHEGIKLFSCDGGIKVLSGDGKQFARILIPETSDAAFSAVIPAASLKRIMSQIANSEAVSLMVGEKTIIITCEGASHKLVMLALQYPDVESVAAKFDAECKDHAVINRAALLHSLKMASVMTSEVDYNVKMEVVEGGLRITSNLQSVGEYDDVVPCEPTGALAPTGINHKMLHAHLMSLRCQDVSLWYYNGGLAFKFEPTGQTGWSWFSSVIRK